MKTKKQTKVTQKPAGNPSRPAAQPEAASTAPADRTVQAEAEDAADAQWLRECNNLRQRLELEHPDKSWVEVAIIAEKTTPPQPPGYSDRIMRCNRCGQKTEHHPDYAAQFCRRCNRWTEAGCGAAECGFCGDRPAKPLP